MHGLNFLLLGVFILSASLSQAQTKLVDFAELERTIEAELKANKTPGAAVAVVVGDKIVYAKGFGTTSAENENSVNADTLFRMGSTTKMFTAAALVTLANAGKIKLDAPIGNYIKNLPPKIAALTAHQLLSQSSGLRDFASLATTDDDAGLKQNILAWKEDVFFTEPNKIYSYSSPNYWLAGFLTEELTGKFYSDAMSEIIFKPLEMTRTCVRPTAAMTYPLALGHNIENGNAVVIRPIANNAAKYPAGSMYSSANELARFAIAFLNGGKIDGKQSLAPMVVEKLSAPQFYLPGDDKSFYGYGLVGFETGGAKVLSHGGVSSGYGSTIEFVPESKYAIIILANRNGETLPKTRQKAMELTLNIKPEKDEQPKPIAMNADEMQRYVGSFLHAPQTWEVFVKDNKLYIKEDGKDYALTKIGKNKFSYEQGEAIFTPNETGAIEHISFGLYSARKIPSGARKNEPMISNTVEEKEVSAVADRLFEAMSAKNAEAIRGLFIPEGQLTAVDKPRDGGKGFSKTRNFSADAFAKNIAGGTAGEYIEKMPEKETKIYGDAALVFGRYTFYLGDKFSHCGTNAFHLVRTPNGWKIANATSTLEFENCESKDAKTADGKDALATVDKLFDLMAAFKPDEIIALHTPESQLAVQIKEKDRADKIEVLSREAFSKFFVESKVALNEKMYDAETRVFGDVALVFGRYVFTINGKLLHCGMDSFHLIRTEAGWKLGNSLSTIEPQGCTEKEKAMIK